MTNNTIKGWIAFYNNKQLEIVIGKDASSAYDAQLFAIKAMNIPKSKKGLISIQPAYK